MPMISWNDKDIIESIDIMEWQLYHGMVMIAWNGNDTIECNDIMEWQCKEWWPGGRMTNIV